MRTILFRNRRSESLMIAPDPQREIQRRKPSGLCADIKTLPYPGVHSL